MFNEVRVGDGFVSFGACKSLWRDRDVLLTNLFVCGGTATVDAFDLAPDAVADSFWLSWYFTADD